MHSKRKERIPTSQVEALAQACKHGKNRDGTLRRHQRRKVVCPLGQSVTSYFSRHLQRVHKLQRQSNDYKDALKKRKRKRNYLGKKKEVMRVQNRSKSVNPKKRSLAKNPPLSDEKLRKRKPLQILVYESLIASLETYCCQLLNLPLLLL